MRKVFMIGLLLLTSLPLKASVVDQFRDLLAHSLEVALESPGLSERPDSLTNITMDAIQISNQSTWAGLNQLPDNMGMSSFNPLENIYCILTKINENLDSISAHMAELVQQAQNSGITLEQLTSVMQQIAYYIPIAAGVIGAAVCGGLLLHYILIPWLKSLWKGQPQVLTDAQVEMIVMAIREKDFADPKARESANRLDDLRASQMEAGLLIDHNLLQSPVSYGSTVVEEEVLTWDGREVH